jgi:CBS domain-containing protein
MADAAPPLDSFFAEHGRFPAGHPVEQMLRRTIRELNPRPPIRVGPQVSIQDAVNLMRQKRIGSMLVCDEDEGTLLGIFTERDLLYRGVAGQSWDFTQHPVEEIMSLEVTAFSLEQTLADVLNVMLSRGVRHFPVVDNKRVPIGILSVRDVLGLLCRIFPEGALKGA